MDVDLFKDGYSKFHYEFRLDSPEERYIADMTEHVLGEFSDGKVSLGSTIPMEEGMVHRNNSRRIRECTVVRLVRIVHDDNPTNNYIAYLKPTDREYKCDNQVNAKNSLNRLLKDRLSLSTEWNPSEDDGYDGWLKR